MSYSITVGEHTTELSDDVDITELKSEVVRNVHAGGGWVALKGTAGQTEVFVSAGQYLSVSEN